MADIATLPDLGCLYRLHDRCWDGCWDYDFGGIKPDHQCYSVLSYPILKATAKRIYFKDWCDRKYFIDRAAFDAEGAAYHRGLRERLHLTPPEVPAQSKHKTVSELKREMAEAHPDRGGTDEAFIAARRRYLRATGRTAW